MKTFLAQKDKVDRKWWLIDAEGQALGRLATTVASILRGKTKPEFTPNIDTGDFVIIINAEKIKTSGKKNLQKVYYKHSGIPGGFKSESLLQLRQRRPERVIKLAVRGMLPHNRLGDKLITKLNIYKGTSHKHHAQKPQKWEKVKI